MSIVGTYHNGFAPRDGQPLYSSLWRGCIGAWAPCLGPTGLTLRDWSGFGRHGTLTSMDAGTDWLPSQGRYCLDLDGSNDYVPCVVNPTLGANPITMSVWVRQSTDTSSGHVWKIGNAVSNQGLGIYKGRTGDMRFGLHAGSAVSWDGWTPKVGKWTHIAGVIRSGFIALYVDGIEVVTNTSVNPYAIGTDFFNIGSAQSVIDPWNGQIDDLRIYTRSLTVGQIAKLASRRGIAYDLAPRRRSKVFGGFKAAWAARKALIQMAGSN